MLGIQRATCALLPFSKWAFVVQDPQSPNSVQDISRITFRYTPASPPPILRKAFLPNGKIIRPFLLEGRGGPEI